MRVSIRNIGKVASADIELNGITAIIGDNDMGKSTTGKALYALFRSMDNIDGRIHDAQIRHVTSALRLPNNSRWPSILPASIFDGMDSIDTVKLGRLLELRRPHLLNRIGSFGLRGSRLYDYPDVNELARKIAIEVDRIRHLTVEQLMFAVVCNNFDECFDGQYLPNFTDFDEASSVGVIGHDCELKVDWVGSEGRVFGRGTGGRDVWFVGTPLVLDAMASNMRRRIILDPIHNELVSRLRKGQTDTLVSRALVRAELLPVFDLLNERLASPFVRDEEGRFSLKIGGQKSPLRVSNLSMGMKVFSVLRLMLESNLLRNGDVVVFDEPENHLHPALQELFARIVVMIQRIFDLRILITTHSPYFLQALELYTRKESHEIGTSRLLKVYQPEIANERDMVRFLDISGDTSKMYRKFAMAMREMDILRREVDGY